MATILNDYRAAFEQQYAPLKHHKRTLNAIKHCRTAYFGGHVDKCDSCDHIRISYNSCRNRHCPRCQTTNRERWIDARTADLLPVNYFHVVFTLPQELNVYCLNYPREVYNILFSASKETIEVFAGDAKHLGAQTGMISVLHTWGQTLSLHPHVHMIIPGGGVTPAGYWTKAKSKGRFLFPVKAMSIVYKNKFMEKLKLFLEKQDKVMDVKLRRNLYNKDWVVYAKQPFGGPKQVIEYLGRYSHKIAISNHRIKNVSQGKVSFTYKDYAMGGAKKIMTLDATEFIRRFCLHILPPGFMKIRHYGILASRVRPQLHRLQLQMGITPVIRVKKDWKEISKTKLNFDPDVCPECKKGKMQCILNFDAHAPPVYFLQQIKKRETEKTKNMK